MEEWLRIMYRKARDEKRRWVKRKRREKRSR